MRRFTHVIVLALCLSIVAAACAGGGGNDDGETPSPPAPMESPTTSPTGEGETGGEASGPQFGEDGRLLPLADGFPESEITIYSAFPPGHADEIYARTIAQAAEELSPVPIVIRNQPTGPRLWFELFDYFETIPGGTEGYATMVWAFSAGPVRLHTVLGTEEARSVEDVAQAAVGITETEPVVLAVRSDSEFETLDDLVAFAQENPDTMRIATSSIGSLVHLDAELLAADRGFSYTASPNDGVGAAQQQLLGGGAEAVTTLPAQAAPAVDEGQLRALLQWGDGRSTLLPDVPSSSELGLRGVGVTRGLAAHPNVAAERIAWLEALLLAAAEQEPYQDRLEQFGQAFTPMTADEVGDHLKEVEDAVVPIIEELGLAAD